MENDFLEKTLEDIIFENKDNIAKRGFPIFYKNLERQVYTRNGKIMDLVNFEETDGIYYFTIYELKKGNIDFNAYSQILNYYFEEVLRVRKLFKNFKVNLVLVGNSYEENVLIACAASDIIDVYIYKYDYNGIIFEKTTKGFTEFTKLEINS